MPAYDSMTGLEQAVVRARLLDGLGAEQAPEIETRSDLELLAGWLAKAYEYVKQYPSLSRHLGWMAELDSRLKTCQSAAMADVAKQCGADLTSEFRSRGAEFERDLRTLAEAPPTLILERMTPVVYEAEETPVPPAAQTLVEKIEQQAVTTDRDKPTVAAETLTTPQYGSKKSSFDAAGLGKLVGALFSGWTGYEQARLQAELIKRQRAGQPIYLPQGTEEALKQPSKFPWLAAGIIGVGAVALLAILMSRGD